MALHYRKTRDGQWVAYGPAAEVVVGEVEVTKRDCSTKRETIERVGRPFISDGAEMAYGYLRAPACDNCAQPGAKHHRLDSNGVRGQVCDRCRFEPSYTLSFG